MRNYSIKYLFLIFVFIANCENKSREQDSENLFYKDLTLGNLSQTEFTSLIKLVNEDTDLLVSVPDNITKKLFEGNSNIDKVFCKRIFDIQNLQMFLGEFYIEIADYRYVSSPKKVTN